MLGGKNEVRGGMALMEQEGDISLWKNKQEGLRKGDKLRGAGRVGKGLIFGGEKSGSGKKSWEGELNCLEHV